MNLHELFAAQKKLDADITANHPITTNQGRLGKKTLALLVELGECANEARFFKFWSNNQEANTKQAVECCACEGTGDLNYEMVQEDAEGNGNHEYVECEECGGSGIEGVRNPLLEEFVDILHFALSIGNDLGFNEKYSPAFESVGVAFSGNDALTVQFGLIYKYTTDFEFCNEKDKELFYGAVMNHLLGLSKMLGFSWEQVEAAYYAKNKINHNRQRSGY